MLVLLEQQTTGTKYENIFSAKQHDKMYYVPSQVADVEQETRLKVADVVKDSELYQKTVRMLLTQHSLEPFKYQKVVLAHLRALFPYFEDSFKEALNAETLSAQACGISNLLVGDSRFALIQEITAKAINKPNPETFSLVLGRDRVSHRGYQRNSLSDLLLADTRIFSYLSHLVAVDKTTFHRHRMILDNLFEIFLTDDSETSLIEYCNELYYSDTYPSFVWFYQNLV